MVFVHSVAIPHHFVWTWKVAKKFAKEYVSDYPLWMSVKEVEQAVTHFSNEELKTFRQWFADFDMEQWDKEIEADSNSGRLDGFISKALEEHRAGRSSDL